MKNRQTPLFSLVIPLYNKVATIRGTICSVLEQDYPCFEVVVVNDGSTDGSELVVREFADSRVKMYSIPNSGVSAARNVGIRSSRGEWVVVLDADDLLTPGALDAFRKAIQEWPEAEMIVANPLVCEGGKQTLYSKRSLRGKVRNPFKSWFLKELMPCAGSFACRRSILLENPYREDLKRSEDVELLFRLFRNTVIYRIPNPVVSYMREYSLESRKRPPIEQEFKGHLQFDGKGMGVWEKICLYECYILAKNEYPEQSRELYGFLRSRPGKVISYHFAFWYRYVRSVFLNACRTDGE